MRPIHPVRLISLVTFIILVVQNVFCQTTTSSKDAPPLRELPRLSDVRMTGELGTLYQAAMRNLLTRQDRYSLETFRADAVGDPEPLWWDWPGDQIGRFLSVVHVASLSGWATTDSERIAILNTVLPLQRPKGNFGAEDPEGTDVRVISGDAFALRGLLDACEDTHDVRTLEAARRLARFFEANFNYYKERGRNGSMHEFYGHCLDGLVHLYELGGDRWALDLAEQIGSRAGLTAHTHHSLSMYRGEMDLYRVTGNADYLRRSLAYFGYVRSVRIVAGGMPENMPSYNEDEGCALLYVPTRRIMSRKAATAEVGTLSSSPLGSGWMR